MISKNNIYNNYFNKNLAVTYLSKPDIVANFKWNLPVIYNQYCSQQEAYQYYDITNHLTLML